jgi:hypothetical protein
VVAVGKNDRLAELPSVVATAEPAALERLFALTETYLDRSGGVALQYFKAASQVLMVAGNDSFERWTATGFLSLGAKMLAEDDPVKMEMDIIDEQLDTSARTFMGLTVGCARCHDHKFDPISTKDFYSLSAFFDNTTQPVRDGNIKDTPPVLVVPAAADRQRWDALQDKLAAARKKLDARKREAQLEFEQWLARVKPDDLKAYVPQEGIVLRAALNEGSGKSIAVTVDGAQRQIVRDEAIIWAEGRDEKEKALALRTTPAIEFAEAGDFEGDGAFSTSIWVKLGRRNQTGAIVARMDSKADYRGWDIWLEGDKVGTHIVNKWPDDALKVVSQTPLTLNAATAPRLFLACPVQPDVCLRRALRGKVPRPSVFCSPNSNP